MRNILETNPAFVDEVNRVLEDVKFNIPNLNHDDLEILKRIAYKPIHGNQYINEINQIITKNYE